MVTKIDNPKTEGPKVYDNKGGADRLVNYLKGEKEEKKEEALFFSQGRDDIREKEAKDTINNNVKGLRERDVKFYSININPSQEELRMAGRGEEGLKEYTRKVMENYAKNFKDKGLDPDDLVWVATVHNDRHYSGKDVPPGKKVGDRKEGDQRHIHVIVSKRDREQKRSINPRAGKKKFDWKEFNQANERSFRQKFGVNYEKHQRENLPKYLEALRREEGVKLNEKKVMGIASSREWDGSVHNNARDLYTDLKKGREVKAPEVYVNRGRKGYEAWEQAMQKKENQVKAKKFEQLGGFAPMLQKLKGLSAQGEMSEDGAQNMKKSLKSSRSARRKAKQKHDQPRHD